METKDTEDDAPLEDPFYRHSVTFFLHVQGPACFPPLQTHGLRTTFTQKQQITIYLF
jgi:hypothetical protein